MSEFDTLADLFPPDRQPTRELEPIQKVDKTDQIETDIDEFYETDSAKRVLKETAAIIANDDVEHRFRYVHATFGSGKSHLLKLIGVATGELEGLESYAHELANTTSGFKKFREAIADSHIDHLQPLFLNLLDRDRDDTKLPLILYEELGRRRGYHTDLPWLLEFCWQLDIEHGLWEQLQTFEHESLQLADVVDRPASLRPWLQQAIPELDGAAEAGLDSPATVDDRIDDAAAAIDPDAFEQRQRVVIRVLRVDRKLDVLASGQPIVDAVGVRQHADATPDRQALGLCVHPENACGAGSRPNEVKEGVDGRRLAGPVGPEKPEYLTLFDSEIDAVERHHLSEMLCQACNFNSRSHTI